MENKVSELTAKEYSLKEWAVYSKNAWNRNVIAFSIDLQNDIIGAQENPDALVIFVDEYGQGEEMTLKDRIEKRKLNVKIALQRVQLSQDILDLADDQAIKEKYLNDTVLAPFVEPEPAPAEEVAADGEAEQETVETAQVAEEVAPQEEEKPAEQQEQVADQEQEQQQEEVAPDQEQAQ